MASTNKYCKLVLHPKASILFIFFIDIIIDIIYIYLFLIYVFIYFLFIYFCRSLKSYK